MTSVRPYIMGAAIILGIQAAALFFFGQPPFCACGYVKVWEGVVLSAGNSQHLADWYTFSHVIHGMLFFGVFTLLFPRMPLLYRFLLSLGLESAWEVIENTPTVIEHYRQQALAQGYTGDSIINSLSDTAAAIGGFFLALRIPVWAIAALVLVMELFTIYMIRDGLALNIMNLIYPFDFIQTWQAAAFST